MLYLPDRNKLKTLDKRTQLEVLRNDLYIERQTFIDHWRDLSDYILPRRARFTVTDNNRGEKKNTRIIDNAGTLAARTLKSGMMGGITSPARPWFRLTTPDPDLAEFGAVKEWLHVVTQRMLTVFLRSNLYNALPIGYGDMGVFGTAAISVEEDFENTIRCYPFPIGTYMIANNDRLQVNVFMREFRYTVRQVISKFGKIRDNGQPDWSNFSERVKQCWDDGRMEDWIDITHVIMPNDEYRENKLNAKYKKFKSCYYETGYSGANYNNTYLTQIDRDKYLRESGYDYFPMLCPRWEIGGEDVYGTSCPGMMALGDIKELQLLHKRKSQALEHMVKPPMTGPTVLRSQTTSILPGDTTYVDTYQGQQGFKPAFQVDMRISEVLENIQDNKERIRRAFFEDLFLMLATLDRREITAREIDARDEEKLLILGPVLEQLNQDQNDPLVDITFQLMLRQGLIPPPPEELQGVNLKVEYISIMAQAQKMVGIAGIERFTRFTGTVAGIVQDPSVLDKVDIDQMIDEYANATSMPPRIVRTDEAVAEIRQQRAQAALARQQLDLAQSGAKVAKDLSGADMGGDNALTQLLKQARAGEAALTQ